MKTPLVTTRELAQQLGVTAETVRRWGQDGCPRHRGKGMTQGNHWSPAEVTAWLKETGKIGKRGKKPTSTDEKLAQEIRKLTAAADRIELQVARERGLLVERIEVERRTIRQIQQIKQALLTIPNFGLQLEGLPGTEIRQRLEGKVIDILARFAGEKQGETGDERLDTN